ncbi:hypothetical protein D3C80_1594510 [compost metagenome]
MIARRNFQGFDPTYQSAVELIDLQRFGDMVIHTDSQHTRLGVQQGMGSDGNNRQGLQMGVAADF